MTKSSLDRARRLLCALQDQIQATLIAARRREGSRFARVAEAHRLLSHCLSDAIDLQLLGAGE